MYTLWEMLREASVCGERLPAGWALMIRCDNDKWPLSHCTPELTPIWWRPWLGAFPPPKQLQKSRVDAPSTLTKGMKSPRPKRLRKERVPWEAAVAHTLGTAKKTKRKASILSLITSF